MEQVSNIPTEDEMRKLLGRPDEAFFSFGPDAVLKGLCRMLQQNEARLNEVVDDCHHAALDRSVGDDYCLRGGREAERLVEICNTITRSIVIRCVKTSEGLQNKLDVVIAYFNDLQGIEKHLDQSNGDRIGLMCLSIVRDLIMLRVTSADAGEV